MSIVARNISKTFGKFRALEDVSIEVPTGELVALLGPSGSGKTTLLRVLAGLESPDDGSGPILFHEEDVSAHGAAERGVGFVFQHYSLFRHMTIRENVAFGLEVRPRHVRPSKAEIRERVTTLLRMVQLEHLADHYPWQLSGGQRQRVALVRALAVEPKVLLLDEPFGALDAKVRKELRRWLRRLHDETGITSVFVTHDQEEALEVSDRIVVMNQGRIEQSGTPQEVYDRPATPFVFDFLGNVNLFRGRLRDVCARVGGFELSSAEQDPAAPGTVVAYVRTHDVEIDRVSHGPSSVPVLVLHVHAAGPVVRVELKRQDTGETLEAQIARQRYDVLAFREGDSVFATLRNPRVFPQDYNI